ncbi:carbohydrate kinase, YjeF related protein [Proteiniborus sp. DW1]|uniref:NAD(P)H-hydrate dehydratase n=1 Tax=Proteiniborus sp. DW1 TaxID=1889883 RepID=UPI00092E0D48|nr:NAD(P)H-hydrate dehydratase [Proteiniborus sp. DW1]SCG83918.1 carbohydrate kinase, YjeF related protein [Proteiniborus sp. DW1]
MISGTGIDIIEIDRIRKAISNNSKFIERIFTQNEIKYIESKNNNMNTISGIFAAKEAVSKALGSGISGFKWTDIEIFSELSGKPNVRLLGKAKELANKRNIGHIHISISHSKDNAVAFAVAEEDEKNFYRENYNIPCINGDYTIIDKEMVNNIIPKREKNTHKGTYGRVGVIGGSKGMTGAVILALRACLRSGSGLVYSMAPESIIHIIELSVTESIAIPIKDTGSGCFDSSSTENIKEWINKMDCLVLGPGMGVDNDRVGLINDILLSTAKPIVLDADGINCVSKNKKGLLSRQYPTVLTPHPAELSRLLDVTVDEIQSNRIQYCRNTAKTYNAITVLKGSNTVIASPEGDIYINTTGNPGMATAGSGDVLSGMIASLIGQKIEPLKATIASVFLHGLAGDIGAMEKGEYGLTAGDIVENIPYTIKYVKSN